MAGLGGVLGRRVAAAEGGYFANRSREALARLKARTDEAAAGAVEAAATGSRGTVAPENADVLPEILRHSIPKGFGEIPRQSSLKEPTLLKALKSMKQPAAKSSSLHQVPPESVMTFGPRKWETYRIAPPQPSTANDARPDPPMTAAMAKSLVDSFFMIAKAFIVASTIVFGGAIVGIAALKKHLNIQTLNDVSDRGREFIQPKADDMQKLLEPVRSKAATLRGRWQVKEPQDGTFRSKLGDSLRLHK